MYRILRTICEEKNLTQYQLAVLVGVERTTINKIEAGTRKPSVDVALKLQEVLGKPIDYLLTSDEKAS